jgi:hypothetical protein
VPPCVCRVGHPTLTHRSGDCRFPEIRQGFAAANWRPFSLPLIIVRLPPSHYRRVTSRESMGDMRGVRPPRRILGTPCARRRIVGRQPYHISVPCPSHRSTADTASASARGIIWACEIQSECRLPLPRSERIRARCDPIDVSPGSMLCDRSIACGWGAKWDGCIAL